MRRCCYATAVARQRRRTRAPRCCRGPAVCDGGMDHTVTPCLTGRMRVFPRCLVHRCRCRSIQPASPPSATRWQSCVHVGACTRTSVSPEHSPVCSRPFPIPHDHALRPATHPMWSGFRRAQTPSPITWGDGPVSQRAVFNHRAAHVQAHARRWLRALGRVWLSPTAGVQAHAHQRRVHDAVPLGRVRRVPAIHHPGQPGSNLPLCPCMIPAPVALGRAWRCYAEDAQLSHWRCSTTRTRLLAH